MMADPLNINKAAIRFILHEDLGKTKMSAKFVPHNLSPKQKAMRSAHCRDIISATENDPNFLKSIVIGDENPGVSNMTLKQSDKLRNGTTRKTTRTEDGRIVRQALEHPTVTRSTIRADVGVAIVPQTISRHLAEANLKSKHPFRALPLTPEHRQLRLQWCKARSMWNVTGWQKVVFSYEFRFVLGTDENRVRVWRHPGERYSSPHTVLRHTARTAGVMV
ncbi:transposable element Tcb2 transposase [Trichonephila clavipes]|uniref:Transposable element Tcb2 transposase n=1 Tax=Trichonephila clavipes TaxID=2585209 RepID=A0A8X6RDD6_TRICX|nr:transposable element Tcb2 transposase [Trichonephila clavipes]